ncbi:MAG TPA: DUF3419 family protein [Gemmatimonadaceae bacterium]|nr:DUF3419 family protein [Gemmatimonadaceae bacterium]
MSGHPFAAAAHTAVAEERRPPRLAGDAVSRMELPGARLDRLYFAQVREDPRLELAALAPHLGGTIAIVGSGGCTALSLLAVGTGRVVAIDLNLAQNHLIELKLAAVAALAAGAATAFLGGSPIGEQVRSSTYTLLRPRLSDGARRYWDERPEAIRRGAITAGVTERFIATVVAAIRLFVHGDQRIRTLLRCRTIEEQRAYHREVWCSRRWRTLFTVLLNRFVFRRTYDPAFFEHVDNPSFPRHFLGTIERALTELPIADNYFVHQMLTGRYPVDVPGGVPPYLDAALAPRARAASHRLTLVDGTFTDWLRSAPDRSIDGFALSNICEWMTHSGIEELFSEIVRTAAPRATVCVRNFVGWTEIPERWRGVVVPDAMLGDRLSRLDRSAVQRRILVARVKEARP